MEQAFENGRKVSLVGRSMMESAEIAQDLGYIDAPEGLLIHPAQIRDFPPEKVCVLISGTQGEPMSALSRAAVDNHKHARIQPGDTVVLSSRIIPGNEKAIYRVVDHLFRRDAHVIYDDGSTPPVHVSGHASQEELKLIINLVKPQYFIPIHGEYRQLKLHAEMAGAMHNSVGKVIMIESGDILEFDELGARKAGRIAVGRVCIDSNSMGDVVEDLVIRDRRHLSEDGIVLPIIAINKLTGKVETPPEIVMRGFSGNTNEDGFLDQARQIGDEHPGVVERRREGRLRHDQGKNSPGPEALHREKHLAAAVDYAGDPGDLGSAAKDSAGTALKGHGFSRAATNPRGKFGFSH